MKTFKILNTLNSQVIHLIFKSIENKNYFTLIQFNTFVEIRKLVAIVFFFTILRINLKLAFI